MTVSTQNIVLANAVSLGATFTSGGFDVSQWEKGSVQAVYTYIGGDTSVGTAKLQVSNDNVNYSDYPSSTLSFNNTTGNNLWEFTSLGFQYFRVVHTYTSGTGGLLTLLVHVIKGSK